jgi:hypothetical protein
MSDCLVYWKTYWQPGGGVPTPEWDTGYRYFRAQVRHGDSLWVVVWGGNAHSNEWRLIQRIYVQDVAYDENSGKWFVTGDARRSQVFDIHNQRDLTPVLRKLQFASGRAITARGRSIGRSIQRSRPLSGSDVILLERHAKGLMPWTALMPRKTEDDGQGDESSRTGAGLARTETGDEVESAAIKYVTQW